MGSILSPPASDPVASSTAAPLPHAPAPAPQKPGVSRAPSRTLQVILVAALGWGAVTVLDRLFSVVFRDTLHIDINRPLGALLYAGFYFLMCVVIVHYSHVDLAQMLSIAN